jgi:peptide/nickel transport system substrate-binding protein
MSGRRLRAWVGLGVSVGAVALAGCGGSSSSSGSAGGSATGVQQGQQKGGTLRVVSNSDFDNVDPGIAYYQYSYEFLTSTDRTLLQYKPNVVGAPSPDLAAAQPKISPDGRTVTVELKRGVKFSPPVNREVTAADVKYGIERGFTKQVTSSYAGSYFGDLVGAPTPGAGDYRPIPGIETPSRYTLVFKLTKPTARTMVDAFVLPLSAPVPKEYARRFDAKLPSQYGMHQVASGPYMFANDKSGKITYKPGKHFTLVRNPNWKASTDWRPAYVDRIEATLGVDPTVGGRQIIEGTNLVSGDTPPASIIKLAVTRHPKQISFTSGQGNRYVSLNTSKPPFDDVNLRRAVYAAIDKTAMQKTRGGRLTGDIATHFIQPGLPGFAEAGGMKGPGYDFNRVPSGNMAVAKRYLKLAHFKKGTPVLMVGDNEAPADKTAQVVLNAVQSLGFKVNFKSVEHSSMYSSYCQVPAKKVDICPNVGWIKDFNDPSSMFQVPFYGPSITKAVNSNFSQLDDPKINAMIKRAGTITDLKKRAAAWGAVDRAVVATAGAVPWYWDKQPNVESKNVKGVIDRWNAAYNMSFTSVR